MTAKVSALRNIRTGQVLRYMFLPGVIPRLREFGRNGFGWLAFLMAYLYSCVRLLPPNHPYLQPANVGKFGMRHVIMEAANRLTIKKENIDQILVFFLMILGFILLVMQFAMLAFGMIFHPAFALPTSFFQTPNTTGMSNPCNDMALQLLDSVFAIPLLYKSSADPSTSGCTDSAGNPIAPLGILPFNDGLHKLIEFYNNAILIVAVAIFLYYLVAVVAETAQSGTPFGRRFAHVYAPLRLVVAVGLLVPLNYGLNSAQYLALYAAKFGSGLATNSWILFNKTLSDNGSKNPLGMNSSNNNESLISRPKAPDAAEMVQIMSLVKTCAAGYATAYQQPPYSTANTNPPACLTAGTPWTATGVAGKPASCIEPYLVWAADQTGAQITGGGGGGGGPAPFTAPSPNYATAIDNKHFNSKDIIIVFGLQSNTLYTNQRGYVYPFCGSITIHVNDVTIVGAQELQEQYYNMILYLWTLGDLDSFAQKATAIFLSQDANHANPAAVVVPGDTTPNEKLPFEAWRQVEALNINQIIGTMIPAVRDDMIAKTTAAAVGSNFDLDQGLLDRGWGGAAIWYNRLALWNGALFGSVYSLPTVSKMPSAMEASEHERRINDQNINAALRYEPYISPRNGRPVGIDVGEEGVTRMMSAVYQYWRSDDPTAAIGNRRTGGIWDVINTLFPFDSLFQIRENVDIHPLAQLCGLGKAIIDASVRNLMIGLAFGAGGGMTEILESHLGPMLNAASGLFIGLTTITMVIGFILYYVLPFLPFMYFYFAIGGWVKTIFEAMVGVPLWALAHLKIDGDGLPGDSALNGYFLIFEIFVRPILTLFGLLGGLIIFSASARALHDIFPLLVTNVGGYENQEVAVGKGPATTMLEYKGNMLDEFFYTVIYTILLYTMGISSFKMIDQIPNNILRWMGHGIRSFSDDRTDPTQGLIQYGAYGGQRVLSGVTGGLQGLARSGGQATGGVFKMIADRNTKMAIK